MPDFSSILVESCFKLSDCKDTKYRANYKRYKPIIFLSSQLISGEAVNKIRMGRQMLKTQGLKGVNHIQGKTHYPNLAVLQCCSVAVPKIDSTIVNS